MSQRPHTRGLFGLSKPPQDDLSQAAGMFGLACMPGVDAVLHPVETLRSAAGAAKVVWDTICGNNPVL